MGRIVVTEYISVDGVVEAPSGTEDFARVGWIDDFRRGPEGDEFKVDETMASDALLFGRLTYDGFAPVWPLVEGAFADKFNAMPKYVVSSTLEDPEWNNTTVLRGDVIEEVGKLKARYDGDIVVHGSPQLAQTLIEHELVDELQRLRSARPGKKALPRADDDRVDHEAQLVDESVLDQCLGELRTAVHDDVAVVLRLELFDLLDHVPP